MARRNHEWQRSPGGDRLLRWTHLCLRCGCRKGSAWSPLGRMAVYRLSGGITRERPDCAPAREKEGK